MWPRRRIQLAVEFACKIQRSKKDNRIVVNEVSIPPGMVERWDPKQNVVYFDPAIRFLYDRATEHVVLDGSALHSRWYTRIPQSAIRKVVEKFVTRNSAH